MPLPMQAKQVVIFQSAVEPMQVDAPPEDNDNNEEEPYIVENPSLDLEAYGNSYTGLARLYRLMYIADHCPTLRIEALKMAISYVMCTYNVALYQQLHKKLQEAIGVSSLPDVAGGGGGGSGSGVQSTSQDIPTLDLLWVESKSKKAALKLEKLDTDLKNYKSNSIKESIRRGHDDLGDHYLDCGDLSNALKCYSRARDYCTSGKHVVNMCLNVIKVSVYLQNWSHVLSYVSKAEATPDYAELHGKDSNQTIQTRLKCAAGLAELATKKYKSAAKHFLVGNFDHCDFPELLSPSNVAMYGGLCALATFDRHELQKNVIFSSSFKLFLELEPQLRDIIFKFYESKYASCLKLLDEIKDNLDTGLKFLGDVAAKQVFKPWELSDNIPRLKYELGGVSPHARLLDLLHKAAYRTGLGNSLFCPKYLVGSHSSESLQHYVKSLFTTNRAAVVGAGIQQEDLVCFAQNLALESGAGPADIATKYSGGEQRIDAAGSLAHVAVAVEGASLKNTKEALAFAVLQYALGTGPAVKWGASAGSLARAVNAAVASEPVAVTAFNASYTDSGLFGFVASSPGKVAGQVLETALKQLRSGNLSSGDITRGKNQLKAAILLCDESNASLVEEIGVQAVLLGNVLSSSAIASVVDSVTDAEVNAAANKVKSGKLSLAAIGKLNCVPYLDQLK
ncbi:COP9 signalosome complex subunit 1-like [Periplaneta americana]|uniref:COP9 signalosome complex subunit 1-like n=1 Tax=Periplaneta americana TaxID=6978 RepID=UPI0037E8EC07